MTDFKIPRQNYLSFDAYTMKQYIRDRLNESEVFTDQNYEGSYLSTINNVIAYTFNSLMYYLNKTSSESMFTEAQVYENMNRIVNMLSYKPIGFQTATLPFTPTVAALSPDIYFIPRYSYFIYDGISYSFAEDILFEKTTSDVEVLTDIANQKLLFQGRFREHALITATGEDNEIVTFAVPDTVSVDHFNIHVYVLKSDTGVWEQWIQTENLYLELPSNPKFEVRFNENKHYEIKFGNNINGAKLDGGDQIAIYYIESDGVDGEVGKGFLSSSSFVIFASTRLTEIINDIQSSTATQLPNAALFTATNEFPSSRSKNIQTVDEIRELAPGGFRSQLRLVTRDDYRNFILSNFSNFIHDVTVANNWEFLSGRIQYLYGLGISNPLTDTATLYAHATFADSCNFNNIYITVCPRTSIDSINTAPILANSQKQTITSTIDSRKTITTEVILLDPIYMAVELGLGKANAALDVADNDVSELYVVKSSDSRRSDKDIKQDIVDIVKTAFIQSNVSLGGTISISSIQSSILSVPGVKRIYTKRTDTSDTAEGISLMLYNPVYPQDISKIASDTTLLPFQFAFFSGIDDLFSKIVIESQVKIYENIEY